MNFKMMYLDRLQMGARTDAGEKKELRRADGAGGENNFLLRLDHPLMTVGRLEEHARCFATVERYLT